MEELLKKIAFLGLGTAALTKEKIEEGIEKLIKKGEITAAEGKRLAQKLLADADRHRKEIAKRIDEGIKQGMAKAGLASIKDIEALKRRIKYLEKRLAEHERRPSHTAKKATSSKKD